MEQEINIETTQGRVHAMYKEAESDALVVMLHGLASSSEALFFADIATATKLATLRFDFAGHGKSSGEFEMLLHKQVAQLQEILSGFSRYRRFIYIGHSKGAALAFLAAKSGDTIISVAGRWNMAKQPAGRYTDDEMQRIQRGETIMHCFSGKMVGVNIEQFNERMNISFPDIMKNKNVRVFVVAGLKDTVMPVDDEEQMAAYFGTSVRWFECGHSGFTFQMLESTFQEAFCEK